MKKNIVTDSKNGQIKNAFIHSWLKRIAVDNVILKDLELRTNSVSFLEDLCKVGGIQHTALEMVKRGIHQIEFKEQGKDVIFQTFRVLLGQNLQLRSNLGFVMSDFDIGDSPVLEEF